MTAAAPARRLLGTPTATALVIANMIGVGVFTTLSYQVHALPSTSAILLLWLAGGVLALCGALCYAELAAALPRSGGEYALLTRLLHPLAGFLAGWVSLVVGFAAPVAAAALAFAAHLEKVWPDLRGQGLWIATALVLGLSLLHATQVRWGARLQVAATILKFVLVLGLGLALSLWPGTAQPVAVLPTGTDWELIFGSSAFAVSLVYVAYAYSGWNAAIYVAGEVRQPGRTLPRALLWGTAIVTALYVLLNYGFLRAIPFSELQAVNPFAVGEQGLIEQELAVGFIAGKALFGSTGADWIALLIAAGLLSTVSAMVLAGPRVAMTMAEDFPALRPIARPGAGGAPWRAVALQAAVSLGLLWTASFATVLTLIGVCLSVCAMAVVWGLIRLRRREPELGRPYRCWGYPFTPLLFLLGSGWMVVHALRAEPKAAWVSLGTLLVGAVLYALMRRGRAGSQEAGHP